MNASCSALLFEFDRTESPIAKVSLQVCSAYPADAPFEVLLNEAGPSIVVYFKGRLSRQGLQLPYVSKGSLSLCQLAGVNSWRAWVACWDCWTRPCVHTRIIDIIHCVTLGYSEVQVLLRVHRWHALWGQRKLQGSAIVGQQSVWHDKTFSLHLPFAGCRPCIGILHHWWASSGGCHTGFGRPLREQRTGWRRWIRFSSMAQLTKAVRC